MKVFMMECTAQELAANKRVADVLIDAFTSFTDNVVGCGTKFNMLEEENPEEETDNDQT